MGEYQYHKDDRNDLIKRRRDKVRRMQQAKKLIDAKSNQLQPKLEINTPDDEHEREADSVAKKVTSDSHTVNKTTGGRETSIQRTHDKEEEENILMAKSEDGNLQGTEQLQEKLKASKGSGQPLDNSTKSEMETKMDTDLGNVKIHTDGQAHEMAEGINAKAFTHGQDIYFKQGNYDTGSSQGKELLVHELTHTVQQGEGLTRKVQRQNDKNRPTESEIETFFGETYKSRDLKFDNIRVYPEVASKSDAHATYLNILAEIFQITYSDILKISNLSVDRSQNPELTDADIESLNHLKANHFADRKTQKAVIFTPTSPADGVYNDFIIAPKVYFEYQHTINKWLKKAQSIPDVSGQASDYSTAFQPLYNFFENIETRYPDVSDMIRFGEPQLYEILRGYSDTYLKLLETQYNRPVSITPWMPNSLQLYVTFKNDLTQFKKTIVQKVAGPANYSEDFFDRVEARSSKDDPYYTVPGSRGIARTPNYFLLIDQLLNWSTVVPQTQSTGTLTDINHIETDPATAVGTRMRPFTFKMAFKDPATEKKVESYKWSVAWDVKVADPYVEPRAMENSPYGFPIHEETLKPGEDFRIYFPLPGAHKIMCEIAYNDNTKETYATEQFIYPTIADFSDVQGQNDISANMQQSTTKFDVAYLNYQAQVLRLGYAKDLNLPADLIGNYRKTFSPAIYLSEALRTTWESAAGSSQSQAWRNEQARASTTSQDNPGNASSHPYSNVSIDIKPMLDFNTAILNFIKANPGFFDEADVALAQNNFDKGTMAPTLMGGQITLVGLANAAYTTSVDLLDKLITKKLEERAENAPSGTEDEKALKLRYKRQVTSFKGGTEPAAKINSIYLNHPSAIAIPSIFYPMLQPIYGKTENAQMPTPTDYEAQGVPIYFFLYKTTDAEDGKEYWILEDTTPNVTGHEAGTNKLEAKQGETELTEVPRILALFNQLNTNLRFPAGFLYYRVPQSDGTSYDGSMEITKHAELADWLIAVGGLVMLIGMGVMGPAGALISGVGFGIMLAGGFEQMRELKQQNMLTEERKAQIIKGMILNGAFMLTSFLGVVKEISVLGRIAALAKMAYTPVMITSTVAALAIFGEEFISSLKEFNELPEGPEKENARTRLIFSSMALGLVVIVPLANSFVDLLGMREENENIRITENPDGSMKAEVIENVYEPYEAPKKGSKTEKDAAREKWKTEMAAKLNAMSLDDFMWEFMMRYGIEDNATNRETIKYILETGTADRLDLFRMFDNGMAANADPALMLDIVKNTARLNESGIRGVDQVIGGLKGSKNAFKGMWWQMRYIQAKNWWGDIKMFEFSKDFEIENTEIERKFDVVLKDGTLCQFKSISKWNRSGFIRQIRMDIREVGIEGIGDGKLKWIFEDNQGLGDANEIKQKMIESFDKSNDPVIKKNLKYLKDNIDLFLVVGLQ